MGLKIVIPIGYQRVKKISLTAMPQGGLLSSYKLGGYSYSFVFPLNLTSGIFNAFNYNGFNSVNYFSYFTLNFVIFKPYNFYSIFFHHS